MKDRVTARPCLVEMATEPKSKADEEKLRATLAELAAEDATFQFSIDSKSGRILLKGADERHLYGKVDALKRAQKVDVAVGAPQVAYRETITRAAEVDYTHKKLTGATGEFARVILEIEPNDKGYGNVFERKIVSDGVPGQFMPSIEDGLNSAIAEGVIAG